MASTSQQQQFPIQQQQQQQDIPHRIHRNHANSRFITVASANAQGLKQHPKLEEAVEAMKKRNIFAVTLQETWRTGTETLSLRNFSFLLQGPPSQTGRGSQGVGIILSPSAQIAWAKADNEIHNDLGARTMAVRLCLSLPASTSSIGLFLISAYAPVSDAPEAPWDSFFDNLRILIARKRKDDLLLIGADCNASLGINKVKSKHFKDSIGQHGWDHQNEFKSINCCNHNV